MKKQIARISGLLLTIFVVTFCQPVTALGMETACVDGICYNIDVYNSIATVIPKSDGYSGEVKIPSIIEHSGDSFVVTTIGDGAFCDCGELISVQLPSTIRAIGNSAFSCCYSLSSITIPDSVESIGENAFQGCVGLRTVSFGPNSQLKHVGSCAFYDCWRLCRVSMPQTVQTMGLDVFGQTDEMRGLEDKAPEKIPPSELEDEVFFSYSDSDVLLSGVPPHVSPLSSGSPAVLAVAQCGVTGAGQNTQLHHEALEQALENAIDAVLGNRSDSPYVGDYDEDEEDGLNLADETDSNTNTQPPQDPLEVDLADALKDSTFIDDSDGEGSQSPDPEATFEFVDGPQCEDPFEMVDGPGPAQTGMSFTHVTYPQTGSEFFLGDSADNKHFD